VLVAVCNIIHNSREIEGDIVEYYGDTIVICLPGEEKTAAPPREEISVKNEAKKKKKESKEHTAKLRKELEEGHKKTFKRLQIALLTAQKLYLGLSRVLSDFTSKSALTGEVSIGMGYGQCIMYHAGGVFKRTVNFAVGSAMSQAQDSLNLATSHQGIILSGQLWSKFAQFG